MAEGSAASNFDNYIAELHDNLDRLRDIPDVDEQCATLVADLAQAYSEQPSPMQTGKEKIFVVMISINFIIAMCLSALFSGQRNILTFLRRASSKIEVKILFFVSNSNVFLFS